MFERVAIIGTGLIGGSLGLAIKRAHPGVQIAGLDRPEVLEEAQAAGAIDTSASTLHEAVADADLIILATQLPSILSLLEDVDREAKSGAIVTDVGSVKMPVIDHARNVLSERVTFVGGHPMAGAAAGGIENADGLLFENAVYVLCPDHSGSEIPAPLIDLLGAIGARILVMDAERHDRIAAAVSHLPQLVAVALVQAALALEQDEDAVLTLAAGGFRDMTRIADSPFDLWRGILAANHGNVLDALAAMTSTIQRLRNRLIEEDYDAVESLFAGASQSRRRIPRDMRGFLHPLSNIVVQAEDRAGWLAEITALLASRSISIKDVELLKIREGTGGTFRFGFSSAGEMRDAVDVLRNAGYVARPS